MRVWSKTLKRDFFAESFPAFRTHFLIILWRFQRPALPKYLYDLISNAWAWYTATPVACGWAGAIFEATPSFGQEQSGQRPQKTKKVKCDGQTDRPTDQLTNGPTKQGVESRSTRLKTRKIKNKKKPGLSPILWITMFYLIHFFFHYWFFSLFTIFLRSFYLHFFLIFINFFFHFFTFWLFSLFYLFF